MILQRWRIRCHIVVISLLYRCYIVSWTILLFSERQPSSGAVLLLLLKEAISQRYYSSTDSSTLKIYIRGYIYSWLYRCYIGSSSSFWWFWFSWDSSRNEPSSWTMVLFQKNRFFQNHFSGVVLLQASKQEERFCGSRRNTPSWKKLYNNEFFHWYILQR